MLEPQPVSRESKAPARRLMIGVDSMEGTMLVLSRKLGEQIRIGAGIEITVLKIHGGRVQIGVQAPRDVPVRRDNCQSAMPAEAACASRG